MRKMIKIRKGNSCHYSVAKTEPLVPIDIMAYYPYACVNPRATWPKRVFVLSIFLIDGIGTSGRRSGGRRSGGRLLAMT